MTSLDDDEQRRRAALLEARAELLRRVIVADEDDEAPFWLAVFCLGGERYALPLASIRAAVPLRLVTPMPLAPAGVVGVLVFQGEILTVLSMFTLLGGGGWEQDPSILLIVDAGKNAGGNRRVAIDCVEIPRAMTIPLRLVQQASVDETGMREITLRDGEQITLIDLDRLPEAAQGGPPRG